MMWDPPEKIQVSEMNGMEQFEWKCKNVELIWTRMSAQSEKIFHDFCKDKKPSKDLMYRIIKR